MIPEEKPGTECDEQGLYAAFDMVRTFPTDDYAPDWHTRREQHAQVMLDTYKHMSEKYGYLSAFAALATGFLEAAAQCADTLARRENTTREALFQRTLSGHRTHDPTCT